MNKLFAAAALALAVTAVHADTATSGRQALVKRCQADATAQARKGIAWQEQVNACVKQGKAAQEAAAQACSSQAQGRNDAQFLQSQKDCLARAGQSPE
ncbi:hypothetical protein HHL11_23495 [Ramlibacter sp. G-1-2-2]|uniref:Uncharacterized protein n=1 Tax=Ramlibacter agri TaxID=2728837 RepID=A0A848HGF0_9BURK|nr:hypothetical protein [Ramlibacter agri]NML46728.1 hypothetical protein [Ramlibacter agri]